MLPPLNDMTQEESMAAFEISQQLQRQAEAIAESTLKGTNALRARVNKDGTEEVGLYYRELGLASKELEALENADEDGNGFLSLQELERIDIHIEEVKHQPWYLLLGLVAMMFVLFFIAWGGSASSQDLKVVPGIPRHPLFHPFVHLCRPTTGASLPREKTECCLKPRRRSKGYPWHWRPCSTTTSSLG